MDKIKAIQTIEKYKGVSRLLGITDDEAILDDIIQLISNVPSPSNDNANGSPEKNKYGEADFCRFISQDNPDLTTVKLNSQISANKDRIVDYWHSLSDDERNVFTIFELNIILYLISPQYNKYQKKDKRRIISMVNSVVKDKRMDDSYNNIVV